MKEISLKGVLTPIQILSHSRKWKTSEMVKKAVVMEEERVEWGHQGFLWALKVFYMLL